MVAELTGLPLTLPLSPKGRGEQEGISSAMGREFSLLFPLP